MRISVNDKSQRSLLEIHIVYNSELIREFFFSRRGLWHYIVTFCLVVLLLPYTAALQAILPRYYATLPLYPALLFFSYLSLRLSLPWVLILALPAGLMLDTLQFQALGSNVFLLGACVFILSLAKPALSAVKQQYMQAIFACALATSTLLSLQLIFFAGALSLIERLALLPRYLLLAFALNALAAGPLLFAVLDLLQKPKKPRGT